MNLLILFVIIGVVALTHCVIAAQLTFDVHPGSDHKAIQEVIDRAAAADGERPTVRFPAGEYPLGDSIRVRGPMVLSGEGEGSKLIIRQVMPLERVDVRAAIRIEMGADHAGGASPVDLAEVRPAVRVDDVRAGADASSVVIENLTIQSALSADFDTPGKDGGSTAILILHADGVHIRSCGIIDVRNGVSLFGAERCIVEQNHLRNVGHGITVSPVDTEISSPGHILRGNTIVPFNVEAIGVWKSDGVEVTDNYCQGRNKLTGGAIFFTSCSDTMVRGNTVADCENGIQFVVHEGRPSSRNVIEDNIVQGCHPFSPTGSGISLQADFDGEFRDNVIRRNTVSDCDAGIGVGQPNPDYHGPAFNTLIEDNTISNCLEWGILIEGAQSSIVRRNRVLKTRFVGIELRQTRGGDPNRESLLEENYVFDNAIRGIWIRAGNPDNRIINNRLRDNFKGEIRVEESDRTTITGNVIHETLNLNREWNDSKDGIALLGGGGNRVEKNVYIWQRD